VEMSTSYKYARQQRWQCRASNKSLYFLDGGLWLFYLLALYNYSCVIFYAKQDGIFVVEVHLVCQHLHERYNYLEYLSFIL
jgi:hypothetical protein